jgi:hypothetical protein
MQILYAKKICEEEEMVEYSFGELVLMGNMRVK